MLQSLTFHFPAQESLSAGRLELCRFNNRICGEVPLNEEPSSRINVFGDETKISAEGSHLVGNETEAKDLAGKDLRLSSVHQITDEVGLGHKHGRLRGSLSGELVTCWLWTTTKPATRNKPVSRREWRPEPQSLVAEAVVAMDVRGIGQNKEICWQRTNIRVLMTESVCCHLSRKLAENRATMKRIPKIAWRFILVFSVSQRGEPLP